MRTIIVAQGMCAPIRPQVLTALQPYGFKPLHVESYAQSEDGRRAKDGALVIGNDRPQCNVAEVTVSDAAARWCEYVLCRARTFQLMSKPLEPRNEVWAARWNTLPRAWQQAGCSAAAPQQPQRPARRRTNARQRRQQDSGIIAKVTAWFR